ncbi:LuxR C-terminal-related transcriptional regulator [Streptomyces sp. NPDC038707]|uniref:LuxR C-terminal-related transcriptional regulator n=1 Tax=Streptomyces sp. NPDC038707 TaxID=3154329 RepID=UPI0033C6F6E0
MLIARGLSGTEIAQRLHLTEGTVNTHVSRVLAGPRPDRRVVADREMDGDVAGVAEGGAAVLDDELSAPAVVQPGREAVDLGCAVVAGGSGHLDDGTRGVLPVWVIILLTVGLLDRRGARGRPGRRCRRPRRCRACRGDRGRL